MVVFQTLLQKSAGPCRQGTHLHTNGTWLLRFLGIEHYEEIISITLADYNFSAKTSLKKWIPNLICLSKSNRIIPLRNQLKL